MRNLLTTVAASALLVTAWQNPVFAQDDSPTESEQFGAYERQPDDLSLEDIASMYEAPLVTLERRNWQDVCQGQTVWDNWGVAPYAQTDAQAFERLPEALRALGIPQELHAQFVAMVLANPEGKRLQDGASPTMRIDGDDHFIAMMSGGRAPHAMCDVSVADIPVGTGGSVVQSALARVWEIEYQGEIFTLVLPEICHNWAWFIEPVPVSLPPVEECAVIAYHVGGVGYDVRHFLWSRSGHLEYSTCNALIQVNRLSSPPSPCDDCVPGQLTRYLTNNFDVGEIMERNQYDSEYEGMHFLVVGLPRKGENTTVCIDPPGRARLTSATVEPEGFYGGNEVGPDQDDWEVFQEARIISGTNSRGEPVQFRIRAIAVIPQGAFQEVR